MDSFDLPAAKFSRRIVNFLWWQQEQIYFSWLNTSLISSLWAAKAHLSLSWAAASCPPYVQKSLSLSGGFLLSHRFSSWPETGLRTLIRNTEPGLSAQPNYQPRWQSFRVGYPSQYEVQLRLLPAKQGGGLPRKLLPPKLKPPTTTPVTGKGTDSESFFPQDRDKHNQKMQIRADLSLQKGGNAICTS